jgi:hypothetical protein
MRGFISKSSPVILIAAVVTIAATGCCTGSGSKGRGIDAATSNWTKETESLLKQAGEQAGVPLQTKSMVHYAQWGASFYTAPAASFETSAATELVRGVDLGVAYVDSPGQKYPKGYYTLKAFANPTQPGEVNGTIQVIGADGRAAAELPATVTVDSMSAPAQQRAPMDVSVAAAPCGRPPNVVVNCFHWTTYANSTMRIATNGLVVPVLPAPNVTP